MVRELLELFFTFFKIGAVTFGGGYAMLPFLERELSQKKGWVTGSDLLDYYAISQVTPGIIAVNVATFVGYKRRRVAGGIFATAGLVSPSVIIITVIALFISNFESIAWVQKALLGINVAVAALLTYAVVNFARKTIKKWWGLIFYAASFCAVYFFKVPSVVVVLVSAAGGVAAAWLGGGLKKVSCGEGATEPDGAAADSGGAAAEPGVAATEPGAAATDSDGTATDSEPCGEGEE